jgi:hypothetical protein
MFCETVGGYVFVYEVLALGSPNHARIVLSYPVGDKPKALTLPPDTFAVGIEESDAET